ncbi:hypothetical protein PCE1_001279 [Barthelona sp. PCE]
MSAEPPKIVLLGDKAVGKTASVRKFLSNEFEAEYTVTIGCDYQNAEIELEDKNGNPVSQPVCIWDIAGQSKTVQYTSVFYRGATAALVLFDLTNFETLESVAVWREMLLNNCGFDQEVPTMLLGHKCDLLSDEDQAAALENIQTEAKKHGFNFFDITSAYTGKNIHESFETIVKAALKFQLEMEENDSENEEEYVDVEEEEDSGNTGCGC